MRRADIEDKFQQCEIAATPQRLDVAEVILAKPQHLSVEQISARLRMTGKIVSSASVYNTLNLLVEKGLIREVSIDARRRLFDSTTHPHHHIYNEDTGELLDVADGSFELGALPTLPEGTELAGTELLIRVRNRLD